MRGDIVIFHFTMTKHLRKVTHGTKGLFWLTLWGTDTMQGRHDDENSFRCGIRDMKQLLTFHPQSGSRERER